MSATALHALSNMPKVPEAYRWTGEADDELFDPGLRHKSGKKPFNYLVVWLSILRPFAYATRDESWGEMEKLLAIVMRNYVRMANAITTARAALEAEAWQPINTCPCAGTYLLSSAGWQGGVTSREWTNRQSMDRDLANWTGPPTHWRPMPAGVRG